VILFKGSGSTTTLRDGIQRIATLDTPRRHGWREPWVGSVAGRQSVTRSRPGPAPLPFCGRRWPGPVKAAPAGDLRSALTAPVDIAELCQGLDY